MEKQTNRTSRSQLDNLKLWEQNFRDAARSDNYRHFRNHLKRLRQGESWHIVVDRESTDEPGYIYNPATIPGTPKLMMESTIETVGSVVCYAEDDEEDASEFLAIQEYDDSKSKSTDANYILTFDLGNDVSRILASRRWRYPKLAHLYGHPWFDRAGCWKMWVSHLDWSPLINVELKFLEDKITRDMRSCHLESDVELQFWPSDDKSFLLVYFIEEGNLT